MNVVSNIVISFRRETICDALAQTECRNFVSKFFSSPQMHARWQHQIPHIRGGGSQFTFWCWVQICGQNFFPLPSALDLEFSQGWGGGWGSSQFTFWCWVQICGQKFFPLPSALDLEFSQGWGGGGVGEFTIYFLMLSPNLWLEIFPFTKRSGLRNGILRKLLFDRGGQCLVSAVSRCN